MPNLALRWPTRAWPACGASHRSSCPTWPGRSRSWAATRGRAFFRALYAEVERREGRGFNPQNVSNILWAGATLLRRPTSKGPLSALCAAAESQLGAFTPQNLSNLVWALGKMRCTPPVRGFLAGVSAAVDARVHEFEPRDVSLCIWGFTQLGRAPSAALLSAAQYMFETGQALSGAPVTAQSFQAGRQVMEEYCRASHPQIVTARRSV